IVFFPSCASRVVNSMPEIFNSLISPWKISIGGTSSNCAAPHATRASHQTLKTKRRTIAQRTAFISLLGFYATYRFTMRETNSHPIAELERAAILDDFILR